MLLGRVLDGPFAPLAPQTLRRPVLLRWQNPFAQALHQVRRDLVA